jgi:hypothetical protein
MATYGFLLTLLCYLQIRFKFPHFHPTLVYRVDCAAGGALEFYGALSNFFAMCTPPDGQLGYITHLSPL